MKKRAVFAALLSALMLCSCAQNTSVKGEDTSAVTTVSAELTEVTESETASLTEDTEASTDESVTASSASEQSLLMQAELISSLPYNYASTTAEDGNESLYYPVVEERIYDISQIFKGIKDAVRSAQAAENPDTDGKKVLETVFYCGSEANRDSEFYFFSLYENNILKFRIGDNEEFYLLGDEEREKYLDAIELTMGGIIDTIAQSFADLLGEADIDTAAMDKLVNSEAFYTADGEEFYEYPPSRWDIFKSGSVISDVALECVQEYTDENYYALYRLRFNVQSDNPVPFKSGENDLALVVGMPFESGSFQITRLADYDDYIHHSNAVSDSGSPEYAVYDYLKYASAADEFASAEDIPDQAMLFYILYSSEPWKYYDSVNNGFDGLTPEQLKAASAARFGREIDIPADTPYYDSASGKYYAQGMGISPPEKYLFTETRRDGEYIYVTVEKYRSSCCLYLEKTLVFTLKETQDGYFTFISSEAVGD